MTHRRLFPLAGIFVSVLLLGLCAAAQGQFTIKQILSAPFPDHLTAAPTGGSVAWVFNAEGVRNLWVAEAPEYKARQLTHYTEDNGFTINDLTWTPDAGAIIFGGDGPNPTSDPEGVTRAIWIVALDGDAPRKLADGGSPAISPDGKLVVFLRRGKVWSVGLEEDAKPRQLFKARGRVVGFEDGGMRFSPDGSQLAFSSNRGDHSFIGVYNFAGKTLHWLDPTVDRDGNHAWSPDSKRIAFIRRAASSRGVPYTPRREGEPWSIRVADVATRKSHEVWRAEPGLGSVFRGVVSADQLYWSADNQLVFPWERDGWKHLYSVPVANGEATLLTPGEFEVEHVAINADRNVMIYSSNQDDVDRRHIWSVSVSGGEPAKPITSGNGNEWSPAPTGDGNAVAILRSGAKTPARPAIIIASQAPRDLAPNAIPADFPSAQLVTPQQVIFPATDGMPIHGQLFLPKTLREGGRHPAVLFCHGGSRQQMLLGFHYHGYYHDAYALNQYLASRGYIVLSVNYRSGIGYGMNFREAINYGAAGASEYKDVEGAGLYLRRRPDVDPDRIGLWGGSYGGYLAALGLARASDLFAAGVDMHGAYDWNMVIRMASIDTWRSPVLLIHGDDDRNVPFISESVRLAEALRKQGVEFEQLIFPDEVYGFLLHKNWLAAYRAAASFFDRKLKNR